MKSIGYQITTNFSRAENRHAAFLEGRLRNCRFALEFCVQQLQLGHVDTASREIHVTEKEVLTILRCMPNVRDEAQRQRFSSELDRILIRLHNLRQHVVKKHAEA